MTTDLQLSRIDIERLPHFRKKGAREYSSACPFCNTGTDRFIFWHERGKYYCRQCEKVGYVTDHDGLSFTQEDWDRWKQDETRRKEQERLQRLSALERLRLSGNDRRYHHQLTDRSFWYDYGLTDETIEWYNLGYTSACPTYKKSAAYTIPVYYQGELFNIRHRLVDPPKPGDKYRPDSAGLSVAMFNCDILGYPKEWQFVLVEGEVKAMVLQQYGFNAVAIPGATNFKPKWTAFFRSVGVLYICLDPGVEDQAAKIAEMVSGENVEVRVCALPVKPDDFFVLYRGTPAEFQQFLMFGEKV